MRWDDLRTSENVEDRRGEGGGFGGGGTGFGLGGGRLGIGAVIVLSLAGWALGIDPRILIGGAEMVSQPRPHPAVPAGADQPADGRRRPLRRQDPGRDRGRLVAGAARAGQPRYTQAAAGAVLRRDAVGLRLGAVRHGAVLLPARPEGLSRHLLLPGHAAPLRRRRRLRLRLCDRARGRPPCREPARHPAQGAAGAAARRRGARPTSSPCASS